MKTLEELRREKNRLISEKEVREDFNRRNNERKQLRQEVTGLKHEKKIRFVKRIGRGAGVIGRGLGRTIVAVGEQYARAEESRRKPTRKRKIKRVRKVKKH